jgi:acetylornithine deacetylase/succinyl-diaminopimelate desuccinylase-like protein
LDTHFHSFIDDLKTLVKIPSISFPGFSEMELSKSAEAVADLLRHRGLENVQILKIPGAHPYVYGERLRAPGKPTLLLYAHHDVQPPGREELWESAPFTPTHRVGPGGERLYGRGTADDKAGIIVHTSAIASYLQTVGELPVNVKVVIEGEEETGSEHLPQFLNAYRPLLSADILVLTDTANFDCGTPALTIALRGMVSLEVEVKALSKTIHSGMWGGPIPDPVLALTKILSTLVDENGQIAIPELLNSVRPIQARERSDFQKIPYQESEFRLQAGLLPQTHLLHAQNIPPSVQVWRLPSLTINAIQASSKRQAGNIINDTAWAKVSIRIVADMDPSQVLKQLKNFLSTQVPWGLEIHFQQESGSGPWAIEPIGPVFQAAHRALEKGYGKSALNIGCGGSIPFVQPFAEALGGAPALLIGVEDPYTNAHGENESLLLRDFKSACRSQIYLFEELSALSNTQAD